MRAAMLLITSILMLTIGLAQATKVCPNCGQEYPDDYNFCTQCVVNDAGVRLVDKDGYNYVISGSVSVTGDNNGDRSGPAVADRVNSNFNKREQLGLITASPSKAGTATASFTIGRDGTVFGVNSNSSNGDLAIEIKSACLSSRFLPSNEESKVTYCVTVSQKSQ